MIISGFLPNPVGPDVAGEWIEILNNSGEAVNLAGWQIKDLSGKSYTFKSGELKIGESARVFSVTTKITLNNGGETVFLYNPAGKLADKLSFSGVATEGQIISHNAAKNILNTLSSNNLILADVPFSNHIIFINLVSALILTMVFFWIIKKLYADLFEQVSAGN